jgi:homoserine kinase type II
MNSQTWKAVQGRRRWVVKAVPRASHRTFAAGLSVAALVEAAGIPAGAPLATVDGRLAVDVGPVSLALLSYVAGDALEGRGAASRRLIGSTLGRVHRALSGHEIAGAERFHWIDPSAPHLHSPAWLRPAIVAALAAWERLDPASLTWGLVHSDPAPEAFLLDPTSGTCGLIDWDRALVAPLLYDLASAVMYVGGPPYARGLLAAYQAEGTLVPAEIDRGLPVLRRMRWAVQAEYFAARIAAGDLTGIAGPEENEAGLDDARRALARWRDV